MCFEVSPKQRKQEIHNLPITDQGTSSGYTHFMILVTGGAGYIGSHAVMELQRAGYEVIVLDNLSYGHRELVEEVLQVKLVVGDISDRALLDHLFSTYPITAVMHFAAYIAVGESVTDPAKYYRNNVTGTLTLLEAMVAASVKQFVFSSTCALYGIPKFVPITEDHPQDPISPYATTKQTVEKFWLILILPTA